VKAAELAYGVRGLRADFLCVRGPPPAAPSRPSAAAPSAGYIPFVSTMRSTSARSRHPGHMRLYDLANM